MDYPVIKSKNPRPYQKSDERECFRLKSRDYYARNFTVDVVMNRLEKVLMNNRDA